MPENKNRKGLTQKQQEAETTVAMFKPELMENNQLFKTIKEKFEEEIARNGLSIKECLLINPLAKKDLKHMRPVLNKNIPSFTEEMKHECVNLMSGKPILSYIIKGSNSVNLVNGIKKDIRKEFMIKENEEGYSYFKNLIHASDKEDVKITKKIVKKHKK